MTVRIVIPLKWESPFRIDLFNKLKELGYRWSKGDSLDVDYAKLHKMAYVAIFVTEPIVRFSSKKELGQKPTSENGFNYIMIRPAVDDVVRCLSYIKQYLNENPDSDEVEEFIMNHHVLKDNLLLL
jgi:hypothetical protein